MRKLVVACLVLVAFPLTGFADSKQARVQELVELLNIGEQLEQLQGQMQSMFSGLSPQSGSSEAERAIRDRYKARMFELSREELGWAQLEPIMIDLYATYFTEQEIEDLIEFHRTPTGQRLIEVTPMIAEESMLFSQEAMMRLVPRMQALSSEMNSELRDYRQQRSDEAQEQ